MAFPRILGVAELAWSPAPAAGAARDTEAFFGRVATLGERLDAMGVTYYPVRGVPWADERSRVADGSRDASQPFTGGAHILG